MRGRAFDPFGQSGFGGGIFDHGFGSRRHPAAFMPSRRHVPHPFHVESGAPPHWHHQASQPYPPRARGGIFDELFGSDTFTRPYHAPFHGKAAPAHQQEGRAAHTRHFGAPEHGDVAAQRTAALERQLEQQRQREANDAYKREVAEAEERARAEAEARARAEAEAKQVAEAQAAARAKAEAEAEAKAAATAAQAADKQPFRFEPGRQDGVEVRDEAYLLHVRPTPTRSGRAAPFDVRLADRGAHGRVVVSEALRGGFHREYDLPEDVRVREIVARQGKNGVLTVTMPRDQPRQQLEQQLEPQQVVHEQPQEQKRGDEQVAAQATSRPDAAETGDRAPDARAAPVADDTKQDKAVDTSEAAREAARSAPRMRTLRSFAERQAHAADRQAAAKAESAARMERERAEAERVAAVRREELRQWRERRRARQAAAQGAESATAAGPENSKAGAPNAADAQPARAEESTGDEELLQVFEEVLGAEEEGDDAQLLLDVDVEEAADGVSSGYYERGEFHPY